MNDPLAAHLDKLAAEQAAAGQLAATKRDEEERTLAAQAFVRLDTLASNPDVLWFLSTFVAPLVFEEMTAALDPKRATISGAKHAERYEIANRIKNMLHDQREIARETLDAIVAAQK